MPIDKKHFIELKFSKLSPASRKSLKKLNVTELAELADQIDRVYGFTDNAASALKELFGDLVDNEPQSRLEFSAEEVRGWKDED